MPRLTDPETVVKRAADALRTLKGRALTKPVATLLTDVVCIDFPRLSRDDVFETLSIPMHAGAVLDEALITERAKQIASLVLHGEPIYLGVDLAAGPSVSVEFGVENGRVVFVRELGGPR